MQVSKVFFFASLRRDSPHSFSLLLTPHTYCLLRAARRSLLTALKQGINERSDGGAGSKNHQTPQQNQTNDNGQEPEFLPLFHERPNLQQKLSHDLTSWQKKSEQRAVSSERLP